MTLVDHGNTFPENTLGKINHPKKQVKYTGPLNSIVIKESFSSYFIPRCEVKSITSVRKCYTLNYQWFILL